MTSSSSLQLFAAAYGGIGAHIATPPHAVGTWLKMLSTFEANDIFTRAITPFIKMSTFNDNCSYARCSGRFIEKLSARATQAPRSRPTWRNRHRATEREAV
jgi:hypothetical protein